ncbi:MAG: hypothetical protein KDA27_03555 [Candidatus Eisenbacteria bacterium]|uniref:Uncharacterized protein n=1 Tax=Eiseniibacteriota bacterium TaxID=2212470 RepID=A0A956SE09_UNCEI|nr:hypothetical protein [Candidatus Eisenbacteria bacterium]
MKSNSEHLTWRQSLDLVEGRDDLGTKAEHLEACESCRSMVDEARMLASTFRFAADLQPSEALIAQVVGKLDHYGPELVQEIAWAREEAARLSGTSPSTARPESLGARLKSKVQDFLATTLVADSWATAAAGVRGASTASPRVLVYETTDYTVSISLHAGPDPERVELDLVCQIAPKQGSGLPAGLVAAVETADGETIETNVEPFGEFRFEKLASSPVRLELRTGEERVVVGPFPTHGAS